MLPLARSKVSGSVLVVLGFVVWFGSIALIPNSWEWSFVSSSLVGGLVFFLVGCFLPEHRDTRFLERKGALRVMAFLLWQSVFSIYRIPMIKELFPSPERIAKISMPTAIVVALGSYFLALFLIRGFRARPEYLTNNVPPETGPGIASPSLDSHPLRGPADP